MRCYCYLCYLIFSLLVALIAWLMCTFQMVVVLPALEVGALFGIDAEGIV